MLQIKSSRGCMERVVFETCLLFDVALSLQNPTQQVAGLSLLATVGCAT